MTLLRPNLLRSVTRRFPRSLLKPQSRLLSLSAEQEASFQQQGILDERGLVNFDTLHEMQTRSCQVFEPKPLFGTYSEDSKNFEWMTYGEFGQKVDRTRAVLKDLSEFASTVMKSLKEMQSFSSLLTRVFLETRHPGAR